MKLPAIVAHSQGSMATKANGHKSCGSQLLKAKQATLKAKHGMGAIVYFTP